MVRRALSAAVGVIVGLALVSAPAAATSKPVTKITFTLDAAQVPAWTSVTGSVLVTTGSGPSAQPFVGAELSVAVDGVKVGSVTTDAAGRAVVGSPMTVEGPHTIRVTFAGDALHKKAHRGADFTVTPGVPPPPAGVPDPPFIFIAEAPAPGLVYLEWTVPLDGGSPILGYVVYRGPSSGTEEFLLSRGPLATSADDLTAVAGSTYYYVVAAVNANGESVWSNEVVVTAV